MFDVLRLLHQHVVMRDRTGQEYEGTVREVHEDVYVLANGDGSAVIVDRKEGNVVSVRIKGEWKPDTRRVGRIGTER